MIEHREVHWVYVGKDGADVVHDHCPQGQVGHGYVVGCYVGAVLQWSPGPGEGGQDQAWRELIDSLEPGTYLITTVVIERRCLIDYQVTHTWERIPLSLRGTLRTPKTPRTPRTPRTPSPPPPAEVT